MIIITVISIVGLSVLIAAISWMDCVGIPNSIERPISTIGFIAKVPLSNEPYANYIIEEKHCSWRLGLGSCGRIAESLRLKYEGDMLIIIQTCADGDYKEFHYKIEDIVGRITISYKS
ncbi:MAG: hypothetical protein [Caudoviricetes sp.]|nr:MAG: hypothetical protein [Caudoviricetes sp.]